jgi:hypothetical protein
MMPKIDMAVTLTLASVGRTCRPNEITYTGHLFPDAYNSRVIVFHGSNSPGD